MGGYRSGWHRSSARLVERCETTATSGAQVKEIVELIPKRVAAFRADGRYPGSPSQTKKRDELNS